MADLVTAKQLLEERMPVAKQITDLNDKVQGEQRDFTAEEKGQWDKLNTAYDLLTRRWQAASRTETILAEQNAPAEERAPESRRIPAQDFNGNPVDVANSLSEARHQKPSEEDYALSLQAWCRAQNEMDLREDHRAACARTGIRPHVKEFTINLRKENYGRIRSEMRSLSAAQVSTGSATIPEGFVNNLERALLLYNGMRGVGDVMRTASGNDMPWPTINATSNKGRIIGENVADSTALEPTFSRIVFRAYKYTSDFIKVPVELLEDSAFQLAATLGDLQGEAIGRIQADDFTTGSGVGKPTGIVTALTANSGTFSAASATAVAFDDLIGLMHAVDPAYRSEGSFMAHDSIILAIRKLKDGQGRYLWEPATQAGQPDRILGYPLFVNQSMDSTISSGKNTVLFGNLPKYKIRDAGEVRMRRLEERFADSDQVAFIAFLRSDGNLLDAGVRPVKVLQH